MARPKTARWTLREHAFRVAVAKAGFRNITEAAEAAGVNRSRLSQMVQGLSVGKATAEKVATALKVPVKRIFVELEAKRGVQDVLPGFEAPPVAGARRAEPTPAPAPMSAAESEEAA